MISVCVTSDQHFFDNRFVVENKKVRRPFESVEEMNASLIKRWNTVVKPDDIVIHLGDLFVGGTKDEQAAIIPQLNGKHKILVMGNRDIYNRYEYLFMGFNRVEVGPWTIGMYTFSHEFVPAQDLINKGSRYNLHGHSHKHDYGDPYFNFCVDVVGGYKPKRVKLDLTEQDLLHVTQYESEGKYV